MSSKLTVKNKRLKVSPGGIITLPVSARRALGMEKGKPSIVRIGAEGKSLHITTASRPEEGQRISPGGNITLAGPAKELLVKGQKRHYWLEVDDAKRVVHLNPY